MCNEDLKVMIPSDLSATPNIQAVSNNLLGRKQCEYFNYEDKWEKEIDRL